MKQFDEARKTPKKIQDMAYRFDSFQNGQVLFEKKKNHLPAMGWNSWNAFGSQNTEVLTKQMADSFLRLGLDQVGYQYLVLDDGCYKPERVEGKLANEEVKFPSGFRALSDYIHEKGLKFGMYNDIGTNLCAGAAVGTCGYEEVDTRSYVEWGVDFIKVDNCYYLWDDATFSDASNAKYVYTPAIYGIALKRGEYEIHLDAIKDGKLLGKGGVICDGAVSYLGTFDGTSPEKSPVGKLSAELLFQVFVEEEGDYELTVFCSVGEEVGKGSWLQVATHFGSDTELFFDDLVLVDREEEGRTYLEPITISLKKGENEIRLMNHRRQENTLCSYAALTEGFLKAQREHDIQFSICEWGKTQPQNWGYKVGDSWRILNDITFQVGADGDPGVAAWENEYTASITSQYNKAVIMDEYAGLEKGWNDPDMLVIGMNGITKTMEKTHMAMWCMMNAPLMLGMDLRRVEKGDAIWKLITNKLLLSFNQDPLGIQAKRVAVHLHEDVKKQQENSDKQRGKGLENPDQIYLRENERVDILAKPLSDGGIAISFFNLSQIQSSIAVSISKEEILEKIGEKMPQKEAFLNAKSYLVTEVFSEDISENQTGIFEAKELAPCDSLTIKVMPNKD